MANPFMFSEEDGLPASYKSLSDIKTLDSGVPDFSSELTYTYRGNKIKLVGLDLSGPEKKIFEHFFDKIPTRHWSETNYPLTEVRLTNRLILAYKSDGTMESAAAVYTRKDCGIYIRRYQKKWLLYLLGHEFGHHWLEYLSRPERGFEYEIVATRCEFRLGPKVLENYQEFWAEAYRLMLSDRSNFRYNYPELYDLIEETE